MKLATFGAGCFWGVEETFRQLKGVKKTIVGYMGGHTTNPTYTDVCSDNTGHAEVVHVTYDQKQITYEQLLDVFFNNHNPIQHHRQGPDIGSQYRSVIFYYDDEQKKLAEKIKKFWSKSGKYSKLIVTEIVKAGSFYKAEEYHQKYLQKRGLSSCHI